MADVLGINYPGFNENGTIKISKKKTLALVADKVASKYLKKTVSRAGCMAQRVLLGKLSETANQVSFQEEKPLEAIIISQIACLTSKLFPKCS